MPEKNRLPSFNSPRKSSILKKTKIPTISPCTIPQSIPKLDFSMDDSENSIPAVDLLFEVNLFFTCPTLVP
jgi:hypothetical protein